MARQGDVFTGFVEPLTYAHRALDVAIRRHRPAAVFGMFSGGHDSLVATHLVSQRPEFTAALHIDTGIGVGQTRDFVRRTAQEQGWPLKVYRAVDEGQDYDEVVLEHGFPGPFAHRQMYSRLKERALRAAIRDVKRDHSDRVLLVTGVRRAESTRRMGTVQTINRSGAQVWCAPLAHFTHADKHTYMRDHGLPRNEVVDHLHMSGECLCGAFAKPGELEWLEFCGYTDVVERIRSLERRAAAAGVPCKWGERPPAETDPGQLDAIAGPLCTDCALLPETDPTP
jgi:3'-phosphoadenosine 5'-phosphosulfate sulfotransferase (PAPS reductase)/FAD synthetase